MGHQAREPDRVDADASGPGAPARALDDHVSWGRAGTPSGRGGPGRGHALGRAQRGARRRVPLPFVVQLDDLGALEPGGRHRREAHHQDGADGEIGGHDAVRPRAAGRVERRARSARSASVNPVVPTTAWIPASAQKASVARDASRRVKSTTTSAPAVGQAPARRRRVDGPGPRPAPVRSADILPAAAGPPRPPGPARSAQHRTAHLRPIRPPAPTTPTRMAATLAKARRRRRGREPPRQRGARHPARRQPRANAVASNSDSSKGPTTDRVRGAATSSVAASCTSSRVRPRPGPAPRRPGAPRRAGACPHRSGSSGHPSPRRRAGSRPGGCPWRWPVPAR